MNIAGSSSSIKTVSIGDNKYPKLLKDIKNPPKVLYYKGNIFIDEPCFAIVGTRMCSSYGKQMALEIAGDLAEAGLTIVSGLAPGIDTFSHQAVIERGKRTIAVLGTGIDKKSIYPQENVRLAEKIIEKGGCVLSEYPPETSGSRYTFPQRNRIISGLSLGVLVIEAKVPYQSFNFGSENNQKSGSGSLITANYAFLQNRKIFAVPGSVHSPNSKGCHYLIKKGAKLAENADDILKELKLPKILKSRLGEKEGKGEENLILQCLEGEALYIDKIIEKTELKPSTAASMIAILEIKGKIRNLGGNIYALKR